jgi:succinoglycan biosynthesis transport protein ExoP
MTAQPWASAARRWLVPIALAALVGLLVAVILARTTRTTYTATTTSFVSMASRSAAESDPFAGSQFVLQRMNTYAGLTTSPDVLEPVITELGLNVTPAALATRVTSTSTPDSVLLTVTVSDDDSRRAGRIADAVAKQQATVIERSEADGGRSSDSPVRVSVVDPARVTSSSTVPPVVSILIKAAAAGLLVLVGAVLLWRYRRGAHAPAHATRPPSEAVQERDVQIVLSKGDTADLQEESRDHSSTRAR